MQVDVIVIGSRTFLPLGPRGFEPRIGPPARLCVSRTVTVGGQPPPALTGLLAYRSTSLGVSLAACAHSSTRGDRCRGVSGVATGGQLRCVFRSVVCRRGSRQHLQHLAALAAATTPRVPLPRGNTQSRQTTVTPARRSSPDRLGSPSAPSCALAGAGI